MPSSTGRFVGHAAGIAIVVACLAAPAMAQIVFPGQSAPQAADTWRAPPASSSFGQSGYAGSGYGQAPPSLGGAGANQPFGSAGYANGMTYGTMGQPQQGYARNGGVGQQPGQQQLGQQQQIAPPQQREQPGEGLGAQPQTAERPALGQRQPEAEAPVAAMRSTVPLPGEVIRGRARALDGGSISIGGQVYRLVGAAAPGRWEACTSRPTSWMCGLAARDTLDRLLARGPVNCTVVAQDGQATLAACRIGRDDLASAMVDAGMARAGDSALDGRQREAQVDGRGIWNELRRPGGSVRAGR